MLRNRLTLVEKARELLLDRIEGGKYDDLEGRLPSEDDLSHELGVSRATIRDVLLSLELEGCIIRRQGIGTFVNHKILGGIQKEMRVENTDFVQLIRRAGHKARYDVLSSECGPVDQEAVNAGMDPDSLCLKLRKVFFADEDPVIYCRNYTPLSLVLPEYVDEITREFQWEKSIFAFLRLKCNRVVEYYDSRFRADLCSPSIAELLKCKVGSPVIRIEETAFGRDEQPLFYGLSHLRSDLVSFRFRRGLNLILPKSEDNMQPIWR